MCLLILRNSRNDGRIKQEQLDERRRLGCQTIEDTIIDVMSSVISSINDDNVSWQKSVCRKSIMRVLLQVA
jgi:hypothetical protein